MSVVERAIRKIQGAAPAKKAPAAETPVARTVVEPTAPKAPAASGSTPTPVPRARGSGRFDGAASGRSIDFDFAALAAAGLLAPGNERLADEYRAIKQPVLRKAGDTAAGIDRLVMVSSSLPNEGKTFTSVNLSLSLALERDWSVLLVDTDCRNPSLSRLLGVADQPGLLDYLHSADAGLESYVLPTNVERLCMLPLGRVDPHAAELLASDRMQSTCAALAAGEYGHFVVIFDSSPLLLTPEPAIIGAQVGQILLVVQADTTTRPAVTDALAKLDQTKTIGLVLNRASASDILGSYSYGYSYDRYSKAG